MWSNLQNPLQEYEYLSFGYTDMLKRGRERERDIIK